MYESTTRVERRSEIYTISTLEGLYIDLTLVEDTRVQHPLTNKL